LNKAKYYTMTCNDTEVWCKCEDTNNWCEIKNGKVITPAETLWHKANPIANFTNNLNLNNSICVGSLPSWVSQILYDQKTPKIEIYLNWNLDFEASDEDNEKISWYSNWKNYRKTKEINLNASNTTNLKFDITDEWLNSSVHWTSWLKEIDIKIYKIEDKNHNPITEKEITENNCKYNNTYTEYNSDWNKKITDIRWKNINLNCTSLKEAWKYKILSKAFDWAWNETKIISFLNIYPSDLSLSNSSVSMIWSSIWQRYANNSDYYNYKIELKDKYDNPIYSKNIDFINQDINNYTWWKTLTTNETNNSWSDVLIEDWSWKTNNAWEIQFKLKSLSPWEFTQRFKIWMKKWNNNYIDTSETNFILTENTNTNFFKKPISWKIEGEINVWKDSDFKIKLNDDWNLWTISNWNLDINKNTIIDENWYNWNSFSNNIKTFTNINNANFPITWNIDGLLKSPKITNNNLKISYILWWKNISYYLGKFELISCDKDTLWLKVIWNLQWDWKFDQTWQKSNFSDLSKSNLRSKIRKNAFSYIKNQKNNTIINWVKYIENNDITINWNQSYETLIVKNWNVVISWDLNESNKKLWIIVLKDNYNINSDYNKNWNIYINKNVEKINAIIYTDWTFRSANSSWNSYSDWELSTNKLYLNWSLFTRNTIGWAVKDNSSYTLPGWQTTNDYDLAEIYDLNYVRKTNSCNEIPFTIKYNPLVQNNPPKLFE
jgi:hypothetical protein